MKVVSSCRWRLTGDPIWIKGWVCRLVTTTTRNTGTVSWSHV